MVILSITSQGLNVKTVLGGKRYTNLFSQTAGDSRARDSQTFMRQTDLKVSTLLSETTLNFSKVIGKHDINAVAGFESQTTKFIGTALRGVNIPAIQNFNLLNPADITVTERDQSTICL